MEEKFGEDIDWEEQFRMMKRWYYRARGNDDILGKSGNHNDYLRAFFIFSAHLEDGLIQAGFTDVIDFRKSNLYLKLAGDISNYSKHVKLTTTRTGDINTKAVNQAHIVNLSGPGPSYVIRGLEITSNGQVYDAWQVAEECMEAWYKFIKSKSLEIPEIPEENIYANFIKWEPKK